jgi:hypothetical protein
VTVSQPVTNPTPCFIDPDCSLPCSQQPATCSYLPQKNPVHNFQTQVFFFFFFRPTPTYSKLPFSSRFPHRNFSFSSIRATCPVHLTVHDLTTLIITDKNTNRKVLYYVVFSSLLPLSLSWVLFSNYLLPPSHYQSLCLPLCLYVYLYVSMSTSMSLCLPYQSTSAESNITICTKYIVKETNL